MNSAKGKEYAGALKGKREEEGINPGIAPQCQLKDAWAKWEDGRNYKAACYAQEGSDFASGEKIA